MYLDYWGLLEFPFENISRSSFFYRSPQHEEAMTRLLYATQHRKGAAMLTGEVGSGKTTVSRAFMGQLAKHAYEVLTIINPVLTSTELIKAIFMKMGLEPNSDSKSLLWETIHQRLGQKAQQGLRTVLVVDEAHVIEDRSTFEHLRMLLNMQLEERFLITMILMGQPLLREKVAATKPLEEWIPVKYHMSPLNFEHVVRYVLFRMRKAGATRGIFTKDSFRLIYEYSQGIPLRINNLCDRSLLIGLLRKAKVVHPKIVSEALEDLQ